MLIMIFNMLEGYFLTFIATLPFSFVMALIISFASYSKTCFLIHKKMFFTEIFFCLYSGQGTEKAKTHVEPLKVD
jgi:hypothetical protein